MNRYASRSVDGASVGAHIVLATRAIGHALPDRAEVHHVNQDGFDNRPGNLVVCQDHAYHMLLHRRRTALHATGNAHAAPCRLCGEWILPFEEDVYVIRDPEHRRFAPRVGHGACEREKANMRNRQRRTAA